jgi:hypothetical protein
MRAIILPDSFRQILLGVVSLWLVAGVGFALNYWVFRIKIPTPDPEQLGIFLLRAGGTTLAMAFLGIVSLFTSRLHTRFPLATLFLYLGSWTVMICWLAYLTFVVASL